MDALFLQQLRTAHGDDLHGATVRRVVCVVHGFVLELQATKKVHELALLGAPGAAWAVLGARDSREQLLDELRPLVPGMALPAPALLESKDEELTALDALRAWILRPAPAAPAWLRLQGAHLQGLRTQPGDRRLWLHFESSGAIGPGERLELVAELIDRSPNFVLRDSAGALLAAFRARRPAPEPPPDAAPASLARTQAPSAPESMSTRQPEADVFPLWDAAANRARPVAHETGLCLTSAAYLELAAAAAVELQRTARRERSRQRKRLEARLRRLRSDADRARNAAQWRRHGELLAANLHRVRRGQERLVVEDLYTPGQEVVLQLAPQLSPQENVASLFKRARRAERGRSTVEARLQGTLAELEALDTPAPPAAGAAVWPEALQAQASSWRDALPLALRRASRRVLWSAAGPPWEAPVEAQAATTKAARGPGRCFVLPGDWEIRVGRSNAENDELTHRWALPDDVWLHASGVPGSHVILRMQGRKGNPPPEVLEAAAAIAARFSRAKHARTVPVLWTRKRYVRKPRRAAPGLAQVTHEKTVFVGPGLPAASEHTARETRRSKKL